jgi:imidazolonepropionase-like amidohydrolase
LFNGTQSLFVHTNRAKTMLDAVAFAQKFKLKLVIVGGSESWMITSQLKEANVSIVLGMTQDLPMNDDNDIDQPYKTPAKLYAEGIPFTISMEGMGWQLHNFGFQAGQAVPFGLPYEQAVKSITLSAAQILGIDSTCGSLEAGKDATLFISEGDALDQRTLNVTSAYIQGRTIDLDDKQKLLYRTYKTKYESQK